MVAMTSHAEQLQYLTERQLAEALQVSPRTIRRRVSERRIPFHKIGRSVRFNLSEVLEATKTPSHQ